MARGRNIKPSFFTNEDLCECHPLARLLFAGLWCHADRAGRLEYRPKRLKAQVLPYDDTRLDMYDTSIVHVRSRNGTCPPVSDTSIEHMIEQLIGQLSSKGFVAVYEGGDGRKYIQITNFLKHQHPHVREPASTIPAPDENGARTSVSLNPFPLTLNPHTENPEPGLVRCADSYSPDFETFWSVFPRLRRTAKGRAWRSWKQAIRKTAPETIIAAATEYAASETGKGQYVVMPATWLNGSCWEDDRQAWNPSTSPQRSRVPSDDDMANWTPSGGDA